MRGAYIAIAILLWFSLGAALSLRERKRMRAGFSEYFIAGGKLSGFMSFMTYSATTYSAFMMVGLVGMVYMDGIAAFGFEMLYLVSTIFLITIFGPRVWAAGKAFGLTTPSRLLSMRYESRAVGTVFVFICSIMLIPYLSVQLMGMGYLVEMLSEGSVSYMAGALIVVIFSLIYSWIAGMRSVATTDALQAVMMLLSVSLLLMFVIVTYFGSVRGLFESIATSNPRLMQVNWSAERFIGLTLPWIFFAIVNPQSIQRFFMPEKLSSLRALLIGHSFFGFFYTVICVMTGLATAVIIPDINVADNAMPVLLTRIPTLLALIVLVGIMAAAVSTVDSIVLTLSSMMGSDVYDGKNKLLAGKMFIPVLLVISFFFAQMRLDLIVMLSSASSGCLLATLPAIVGCFFWKRSTASGAVSGMIIGSAVTVFLYISGIKPLGQWPPVWGLLISVIVFVITSMMTKPPREDLIEKIEKELHSDRA